MYLAVGPGWWVDIAQAVMIAAVIVTVITGIDYLRRARELSQARGVR